jgi:hypothetical protein
MFMNYESYQAKQVTLQHIAGTMPVVDIGNATVKIGQWLIHLRFCSDNQRAPGKYKFNINPNTLRSDYELWICGRPQHYYFMPVSLMKEFYHHPEPYVDSYHPNIHIVSVDYEQHKVTYARGGTSTNLIQYLCTVLPI